MHYPRKVSNRRRKRRIGFRARNRTASGKKMLARKRRAGRKLQVV